MSRRSRAAKRAAQPQQRPAVQPLPSSAEQDPAALRPEPARSKRLFRDRVTPIDGGIDVHVLNVDGALEGDIVVRTADDLIIIATGEAAASIRSMANPLALLVPTRRVELDDDRIARGLIGNTARAEREDRRSQQPVRRGNSDTFVSSSRIRSEDPFEEEEGSNQQENGMPRAPRDRTRRQRMALVVQDDKGNPALQVEPEALANVKEAAITRGR